VPPSKKETKVLNQELSGRNYSIEDIFENFDDYEQYFVKALTRLKDGVKRRVVGIEKNVPERLRVTFSKSIKVPEYYIPRGEGVIILELPDRSLSPRKKAAIAEINRDAHIGVIQINERANADQIAMRMKIFDSVKSRRGRSKVK